jgi:hypothetical protein
LIDTSVVAGGHEQLDTYKVQDPDWAEYNLSLKKQGSLSIWFDPEMVWDAAPSGRRGRQQAYSDAAIGACLTLKVSFVLPLGQTTGFCNPSQAYQIGLVCPKLQQSMSPLAGIVRRDPIQGRSRTITPADR